MKFLLLLFLSSNIIAQTASFSVDTIRFKSGSILEAEWRINQQALSYGSKALNIAIDNKIDTILYKAHKDATWDTIICNINQAQHYTFHYNPCCRGFNIHNAANKRLSASVKFMLKGTNSKIKYLASLGETSMLLRPMQLDTLNSKSECRSAMSSDVYQLTLSEIAICKDENGCEEATCLYEQGKEGLNYNFAYKPISFKMNCLFLPLSDKPVKVVYDQRTGRVKVE